MLSERSKLSVKPRTSVFQLSLARGVVDPISKSRRWIQIVATIKSGDCSQFGLVSPANLAFGLHPETLLYGKNAGI